jgi:hypothetical protein
MILGYRRTTANESSPGIRPACGMDEMNDHQREQSRRQNSAYRHRIMKGAFGNESALLPFCDKTRASDQMELLTLEKIPFHVPAHSRRGSSSLQVDTVARN